MRVHRQPASGCAVHSIAAFARYWQRAGVGGSAFFNAINVFLADMVEFDAFYQRLIDAAPMKNVSSRFAMERMKHSTGCPCRR
jgi:hypothetical protein